MDGGTRIAEVLKAHGVPFIFTLVGGHISPILVASKKLGIRIIDTRHEVNAVFAADAVGRLTGTPGVAVVTAGPGVTNALTAIKNAQLAQSPLVLIGGATATLLRGRGSLQDIDQMALIEPHVKWTGRPNKLKEVVPTLEKAFRIANRGVPGPVFVELAVDLLYEESVVRSWYHKKTDKEDKTIGEHVQSAYIKFHLNQLFSGTESPQIALPQQKTPTKAISFMVKRASRLIRDAKRPLMVLGSQTMLHPDRADELVRAIERIGVPVYLSGMARGLLGKDHPLQMRHKRRIALRESDVVILCGVPCDFRLDYGSHVSRAKVIGVNLSPEDLNKNRRPELGVLADPHTFLSQVALASPPQAPDRSRWFQTLEERNTLRETEIAAMTEDAVHPINPLALCKTIDSHLAQQSILVGDGGDFVATAAYTISPRGPYSWLDPGVFGTLGVGAGFALGAKLVNPEADVWLLYGDGAAGFSMLEFDTFARHNIPVIAVVGNDAGWTQILRDQEVILKDDVACKLTHMDYHVVAEGCGAKGILIKTPDEMEAGLKQALELSRSGVPVCVNALLGRSDFRKGSISI
jgi:acetolactate synthase-like protein